MFVEQKISDARLGGIEDKIPAALLVRAELQNELLAQDLLLELALRLRCP